MWRPLGGNGRAVEALEERPRPVGKVAPAPARHHVPVDDGCAVDVLGARLLDVRASGGKPDERLPRSSPSAAGTCGPWQSVPTGFSSAKKCSTIRLTSGSTRMNSGALPPGITIAAYSEGSTSAKATSTGQLRPGFSTYVSKSASKSWTTS